MYSVASRIHVPHPLPRISLRVRNIKAMRTSKGCVARRISLLRRRIKRVTDKCRLRSPGVNIDCDISGQPATISKSQMGGRQKIREEETRSLRRGPTIVRLVYRRSDWPRSPLTDRRKSRCHRLFQQLEHVRASEKMSERTNEGMNE